MSVLSGYKSAPMSLFGTNGGVTSTDASLVTLTGVEFEEASGNRKFVLVQNGGTALVSGVLVQSPVNIGANHQNLAVTGSATVNPIGATSVTVTAGGTLITAQQYQGGYAYVNAGTGIGQTFKIKSIPAASSAGTCLIQLEDALSVALDTTSKISLTLPQYGSPNGTNVGTSGVVVCPVVLTGRPIGVTISPIPASTTTVPTYAFIQKNGAVACINDATTAIGLDLMPSTNTAGSVMTYVAATGSRIGTSTVAGVTTEARMITLQL